MATNAEVLLRPDNDLLRFLPEGPYSIGSGQFSWVAIQHGADATTGSLNLFDCAAGVNQSFELPGRPGFAFLTDKPGVFVAGVEHSLGLFNTADSQWTVLADGIDAEVEGTIVNDGVTFDGNLIFGCKDLEFATKKAGLYLWRRSDRSLVRLRDDQICSNGKAVIEDNGSQFLIDIDTPTQQVVRYPLDVEGGTLGDVEVVVDLTSETFFPDGMILTPDRQSAIIAFYNPRDAPAGVARQYSLTSGEIEAEWTCAQAPQVTCPQLVEIDGRVKLVLTTAVEHMEPERQAVHTNSGCLFVADTPFDSIGDQPVFPVPT